MKRCIKITIACLLLVLPMQGRAQSPLDDLLQGNGLETLLNDQLDLGTLLGEPGNMPTQQDMGAVIDLLDQLGQGTEMPSIFGELSDLTGTTRSDAFVAQADVAFDSVAHAQRIARAKTCGQSFVMPLVDQIVKMAVEQPFGDAGESLTARRGMVEQIVSSSQNDPCGLRNALLIEAVFWVFDGRFTDARQTFEALLPEADEAQGATALILQLVDAVVLSLQQRNALALEKMEGLREPFARVFRPQSRMVIMLEGGIIDVRLQSADAALAAGLADSQENPLLELKTDAARLSARILALFGETDELYCLAIATEGSIHLRLGEAIGAKALLQEVIGSDATCDTGRFLSVWPRHNLGLALAHLGEYPRARQLLEQAEAQLTDQRAPGHPLRIANTRALAEIAMLEGRADDALALLSELSTALSGWLGGEITGVSSHTQRRAIASLQSAHQNLAILIALAAPRDQAAQVAAAQSVLRFKGIQAEEDATLLQAMRDNRNLPLVNEITRLRSDLATAQSSGISSVSVATSDAVAQIAATLAAAEAKLGQQYPALWQQQASRNVTVDDIQAALVDHGHGALVEYRKVVKRPFGALTTQDLPLHWVAVVVHPDAVHVIDLGLAKPVDHVLQNLENPGIVLALQKRNEGAITLRNRAQSALYDSLVRPLGLTDDHPLFLAPEAELGAAPFFALSLPDGTPWIAARSAKLAIIDSGRELVRDQIQVAGADNLLAFGGIDFGEPTHLSSQTSRNLAPLKGTLTEMDAIVDAAKAAGVTSEFFSGSAAQKSILTDLAAAPRYLHLGTHGLSTAQYVQVDRPSTLASIAFSNANLANSNALSALEAQSLDLSGTQLVTLSACDTALGVAERGEGIHSMARAFRLAGANYVVVTRRDILDVDGQKFMVEFYDRLFATPDRNPAMAFSDTMEHFALSGDSIDWPAFTLIGL